MKFIVDSRDSNWRIENEASANGMRIRISFDCHVSIVPVPDEYGGPCVQVLQTDPLLLAFTTDKRRHAKRPNGRK